MSYEATSSDQIYVLIGVLKEKRWEQKKIFEEIRVKIVPNLMQTTNTQI